MMEKAVETDPDALHVELAETLEAMGQLSRARHYYERAARAYIAGRGDRDGGATCMASLAVFIDDVMKDHGSAEAWYRTAIEHDRLDASVVSNYAWFLRRQGQSASSRKILLEAIHRSPISATAHCFYSAFLHQTTKDMHRAQWHFARAKLMEPDNSCVNEMEHAFERGNQNNDL